MFNDILLTPLRRISHPQGDILHGIKKSSLGYEGFGEAYFSTVHQGVVKGWKKHTRLSLNLVVPKGEICFVICDGIDTISFKEYVLGENNYQRLTVPCGYWVAFQGLKEYNLLMNVISEEHDPDEAINADLNTFNYSWRNLD